ncbi:MAG: hypothetical protein GY874_22805 [Desulfobacteraceae bacterium]|nr:hypothetical protein [Desulfobacteraceae bacterium]
MFNANDKMNFLRGRTPAVLYLWTMAEKFQILNSVCQKLDETIAFDSSSENNSSDTQDVPSSEKKKRRREHQDEVDLKQVILEMKEARQTSERNARLHTKASERDSILQVIEKTEGRMIEIQKMLNSERDPDSPNYKWNLKTLERIREKIDKMEKRYDNLCEELDGDVI